ncbi:carbohydrate sulfotransferase 3-like [Penaeus monodon]|uniref:carbohydrate sulfotransferase 3-like n=1 Tax=Penaeus monodon TaxID=6687 RepID=UPI0018A713E1|nr:carbohydrate sulfotransferase 3-like [Penaeus monodon]
MVPPGQVINLRRSSIPVQPDMKIRILLSPLFVSLFFLFFLFGQFHLPKEGRAVPSYARGPYKPTQIEDDRERERIGEGGEEEGARSEIPGRRKEGTETGGIVKDSEKRQKLVILWTGWRSGSTFMGQVLSRAANATFYSYEPLHMYGVKVMDQDDARTRSALVLMKDLLLCRLESHSDQVSYMGRCDFYLRQNVYLKGHCLRDDPKFQASLCRNASYVAGVCRSADMNVIKVLRLSLQFARPLLEDDELDVQIIYMARDPRAVLSSRMKAFWCTGICADSQTVCSLLEGDLRDAALLSREYPTRFKFVLYDEICDKGLSALQAVMTFLDLPVTDAQIKLLPPRQTLGMMSISRADMWRTRASFAKVVEPLQRLCEASLEKLQLRAFASQEELLDLSRPALLRSPEI